MRSTLLIKCPDRPGIVAAISSFLFRHGANITDLDQHSSDGEPGVYFMRLEFQTARLDVGLPELQRLFAEEVAGPFSMEWRFSLTSERRKVAILVSRHDHAMLELLWNWKRGDLPAEVTLVVSNHPDLRAAVEAFGVHFEHVPNVPAGRHRAEERMLELLEGRADLVVLARYMQIVSPAFIGRFPHRIINIHHSFLPAFAGARPYHQAHERGVKVIGATAHYVTADLDAGPIIEQDVVRVSHRDTVEAMIRKGRDLEKSVLARAVRLHLEDRVLVYGNKTVVFD
jgi:formyltetrahydrofolate deformylase